MGTIRYFGRAYDGPVYDDAPQVDTPTDEQCIRCGEKIREGDGGFMLPYSGFDGPRLIAYHRQCFLREIGAVVDHSYPCPTEGCPGDGRYAAPERRHLDTCRHP